MDKFLDPKNNSNKHSTTTSAVSNNTGCSNGTTTTGELLLLSPTTEQQGGTLSSVDFSHPLARKKLRTEQGFIVMDIEECVSIIQLKKKQISVLQMEVDELENLLTQIRGDDDKLKTKQQETVYKKCIRDCQISC